MVLIYSLYVQLQNITCRRHQDFGEFRLKSDFWKFYGCYKILLRGQIQSIVRLHDGVQHINPTSRAFLVELSRIVLLPCQARSHHLCSFFDVNSCADR